MLDIKHSIHNTVAWYSPNSITPTFIETVGKVVDTNDDKS